MVNKEFLTFAFDQIELGNLTLNDSRKGGDQENLYYCI